MKLQQEHGEAEVRVFLIADAVTAGLPNQLTPRGYYNIERMFKAVIGKGGQVKICRTCAEGRGIEVLKLIESAEINTMSQLALWVMNSDKVLTF